MSKRILVVDDDVELCNLLTQCLGGEGFAVSCCGDGRQAFPFLKATPTDLVILDVMLPEMDGFEVLRQIRAFSNLPVLMLSAKGDEMNKVLGLKIGADDYLTKPFGISELIARVENLFRRCASPGQTMAKSALLTDGELQIDTEKCRVTIGDAVVSLTSKEYKLLCFLAENPQRVFTKKQIYNQVWEADFMYDDNTIMALISRLRKKLEREADGVTYIQTVWGIGYRFSREVK
ncbi:MAG: response regulator transcription factor [Eubacteriaceae bacterium]|nr:response regulator transcription factor [Eubacteriaceae bacterium]